MNEKILTSIVAQIDPIQLLERVELFYNNAWGKLIIFVSISTAIIGILVPLVIQWLQKRTFTLETERLKSEMKLFVDDLGKDLENKINKIFKEEREKIEQDIEKRIIGIDAENLRLHATHHQDKSNWEIAALWWSRAIKGYVSAGEDELIMVAVNSLERNIKKCEKIKKANKEEITRYLEMIPKILWYQKEEIEKKLRGLPIEE